MSLCCQGEPFRNPILKRTTFLNARRIVTINATTGLRTDGFFIEQRVDFVEITNPRGGGAFRRRFACDVTPSYASPASSQFLVRSCWNIGTPLHLHLRIDCEILLIFCLLVLACQ